MIKMILKFILLLSILGLVHNTTSNNLLNSYIQQSQQCIDGLIAGATIVKGLLHHSDNEAKIALDLILLNKLFKNQIKQTCHYPQINSGLKSGGVCLQSLYQLSLTVQTIQQNIMKGNYSAAFKNFQLFLDDLPDTLDSCGQSQWADKIRKDFPAACLKSFDDLGKQLIVFEHNYDHLEWLFKHWKDLQSVLKEVKKTCPIFA